jgi:membrane protein YqaA with SNARE-associated domain
VIVLVAIWAFAEALVWFVVADVPISAIALRRGFGRAARASLVAAVMAALGGLAMVRWTMAAPETSRAVLEHVPGIGAPMIDDAVADWRDGAFSAMLGGSFSGVPYKVYAHAGGIYGTGFGGFLVASIAARLPRFLVVSTVSAWLGPLLRRHLSKWQIVFAFTAFWMMFYCAYFMAVGA